MVNIDAYKVHYRELNQEIKDLVFKGEEEIVLENINGQRYIGSGLANKTKLIIEGTPGNDLAAFASKIEVVVKGNGQDGIANTINDGKVVVEGHVGDALGYSMRGGKIYIKDGVGYRAGIHMKGYQDKQPLIIIGGKAGDFLGEYMAGGRLILLGLDCEEGETVVGNYVAAGMHGGVIYIRGKVEEYQVGMEVKILEANGEDRNELREYLREYCQEFNLDLEEVMNAKFTKLIPASSRPYGNMYAY
jgi:glutamate synthase domain-containing protein 3